MDERDKPAALEAVKLRIAEIDAREAERLRLAGQKRARQSKLQAKGMAS